MQRIPTFFLIYWNCLTKNTFSLNKKNFIILCPIKFWTSDQNMENCCLFLFFCCADCDWRREPKRAASTGWQWCCRLFNANSMKAVSMSTWSTVVWHQLRSSVSNSWIAGSRFKGSCTGEASSVVGLEKHEKFKQGDSADNEDELCFVCYKNCKWQAIHHSFGFRADSDWMAFWLADWLTECRMCTLTGQRGGGAGWRADCAPFLS